MDPADAANGVHYYVRLNKKRRNLLGSDDTCYFCCEDLNPKGKFNGRHVAAHRSPSNTEEFLHPMHEDCTRAHLLNHYIKSLIKPDGDLKCGICQIKISNVSFLSEAEMSAIRSAVIPEDSDEESSGVVTDDVETVDIPGESIPNPAPWRGEKIAYVLTAILVCAVFLSSPYFHPQNKQIGLA